MDRAKTLAEAIALIGEVRRQNAEVPAIWSKVNRVAEYLNKQLAEELINW